MYSLLTICVLLVGCNDGGSDNNNFVPLSTTATIATITPPSGAALAVSPGVPYTFEVTISGVNGVGAFSASLDNVSGTASFAGLSVAFGSLTEVDFQTFRATGTLSGPFQGAGSIKITATYTEPGINIINNEADFIVTIPVIPASITFDPVSPLNLSAGEGDVIITASGTPAGGAFTFGGIIPGSTGGTFSLLNAVDGIFSFGGSTNAGVAEVEILYSPNVASGSAPVLATYTINVSNIISVNPASPLGTGIGAADVTITAGGSPSGGVFSLGTVSDPDTTGGAFQLIDPSGIFSFGGASSAGTVTADLIYAPPGGGATATFVYVVDVSNISFDPISPATLVIGEDPLEVTVTGNPAGGTISFGVIDLSQTGGIFAVTNATAGTFNFSSPSSLGLASVEVIYTPPGAAAISASYQVQTGSIIISQTAGSTAFAATTASGSGLFGFPLGSPDMVRSLTGDPEGGIFAIEMEDVSATGGDFVLLSAGPTTGEISYGGATSTGTAVAVVSYTLPGGARIFYQSCFFCSFGYFFSYTYFRIGSWGRFWHPCCRRKPRRWNFSHSTRKY